MRNFFWPRDLKQEANVAVRIGRAIQWLSVVAAALVLLGTSILAVRLTEEDFLPTSKIILLPLALAAVITCWGVGRILRYIIAGE